MERNDSIKVWYQSNFKTDELGEDLNPDSSFTDLVANLPNVYDYIGGGDSIVRERIFTELASRMNVDYNVIYNKWLEI